MTMRPGRIPQYQFENEVPAKRIFSNEEKRMKKMPSKPKPINAKGVSTKGIPSNSAPYQRDKREVDDLSRESHRLS
jgi:hypothetical protein